MNCKRAVLVLLFLADYVQAQTPGYSVQDYSNALRSGALEQGIRPDSVDAAGAERVAEISTLLGTTRARWSRSVEKLFGTGTQAAVQNAWTAAARAIAQNSFPPALRRSNFDWRLAIMDQVPAGVDPGRMGLGAASCHPAWMRPPADIYVAALRVATRCGNQRLTPDEASKELAQSLIHEIGHAVEFEFMGRGFSRAQRWHSEGFARWFETLAGEHLSGRDRLKSKSQMLLQAKRAGLAHWRPSMFQGSVEDYARAYALIAVIADGRSISRLSDVYKRMDAETLSLGDAVKRELGWDESRWIQEAIKFIEH